VKLGELQDMLARAISEPDTLAPALLETGISARGPLDASARAGIYREMYRFRLADALRADFPRVARLLGDDGFLQLSSAYASVYPSASSDISRFGRHLADFLRAHPGPRGDEADLARLEWALAEAFTAQDAEPVTQEALGRLGAEAAEARLVFVPALQTLVLEFDVLPLWAELETSDEPPEVDSTGAHVAVWRQGFQVLHRALGVEEAEALARARTGATLAEVCEPFGLLADPQGEAFRTLAAWFSSGLVSRVEGP
jgi:Putative DNA-binding domain